MSTVKRLTTLVLSIVFCSIVFCTTVFCSHVSADDTRIAVAANFTAPMNAIVKAFEQTSGHKAIISFGSSGKLFAQIRNGAPFDAFLSADSAKPGALIKAGSAVPDSRFTYALGTLALWGRDSTNAKTQLQQGNFKKLAIANPRLAPYGAAALETLQHLGLGEKFKSRLVRGENISQTYQFVASGNAELGFLALSQVIKDGKAPAGAWVVPASLHTPIQQDAILLKRGATNPAATALLQYLRSEPAKTIIRRYGYAVSGDNGTAAGSTAFGNTPLKTVAR